jgi:hypothetical protein
MPNAPVDGAIAVETRCLNCDRPLTGQYCSGCGQKDVERDPRLRELAHEAADELLHWDGKLAATLGALARRPGFLTREDLAGRRARYVSPLRLYLTASVVYFAILALIPRLTAVQFKIDDTDRKAPPTAAAPNTAPTSDTATFGSRKRDAFDRVARDPAKFQEALRHNEPKAMFVLLPVFALVLRGLYRTRGRYPAHFIFALHVHAFAFLLLAIATAPAALSAKFDGLDEFAMIAILVYVAIALRRTYDESWARTVAKTGALAMSYLLVFGFTLVCLMALTALTF